jgi:hypothetical protein
MNPPDAVRALFFQAGGRAASKGWLALTLFSGLALMLLAAVACGHFLYRRRGARRHSAAQPAGNE